MGDVRRDLACVGDIVEGVSRVMGRVPGFVPSAPLEDGLRGFAKWYKAYYGLGASERL